MTNKIVSNNTLKSNNKSSQNKYNENNKNHNKNNKNSKNQKSKKNHNNNNKTYNIKVGEKNFCLSSESLNYDAPNFFTAAFFGYFSESKTTNIFIERDPTYFSLIVRYLRGYEVNWPINDRISMSNLLSDVKFYSFGKLQIFLEEIYEKNFPEKIIPWKILTYAPENDPVIVVNIKDIELERWDSHSLIYNVNPIPKKKSIDEKDGSDGNNDDNDDNGNAGENEDNGDDAGDNVAVNNDIANNEDNNDNENATNNDNDIVEPNADKGLYRLEVHGKGAFATVTSSHNNGIKFENFTLKNPEEEKTFRALTKSFRTSDDSLTLSPSLKLPFLKDSCIEINGSKYYNYNELSSYFGLISGDKKLYFEEIVLRINDGTFLMRARAWTIPYYYASQSLHSY